MGDTLTREATREHLRKALVEHLREGNNRPGADLVQEVSLELDATPRSVVAALWDLIEDGEITYEPGAHVTLAR